VASSAERKAQNEARFREANEGLQEDALRVAETSPVPVELVPFLCECPDLSCRDVVLLGLDEYENVRSVPERGLARKGHEDLGIERVVAVNDRFVTTEKFGPAGESHRRTYPRS